MDKRQIARVRAELDEYVGDVFASLARRDQRDKGGLYLRGLMLDGRRKSMQPMGDRLGIDYQQLQQFVSSSKAGRAGQTTARRASDPGDQARGMGG